MKRVTQLSPGQKAKLTGRWAKTMTKWLITFASRGGKKWQLVAFDGAAGGESTGIVDFLAIRKNHRPAQPPLKRGDCFEIVLLQVKGGSAVWPTASDVTRLRAVGHRYHAQYILLAEWHRGRAPGLFRLHGSSWVPVEPVEVFGR
jgi:hypothetical protein